MIASEGARAPLPDALPASYLRASGGHGGSPELHLLESGSSSYCLMRRRVELSWYLRRSCRIALGVLSCVNGSLPSVFVLVSIFVSAMAGVSLAGDVLVLPCAPSDALSPPLSRAPPPRPVRGAPGSAPFRAPGA